MSLVKAKNISMSDVTVSYLPYTLDNGAKLVYVNHRGGRFNVQTVVSAGSLHGILTAMTRDHILSTAVRFHLKVWNTWLYILR